MSYYKSRTKEVHLNDYDMNWDSMDSNDYGEMWEEQHPTHLPSEGRVDWSGQFREDQLMSEL